MPRPKHLDLGAKRFSVVFAAAEEMDETDANGYARYDDCEIVVLDSLKPQTQANVLLHEALHIMYRRIDVPGVPPMGRRLVQSDFEELVVVTMADGVCELFRRNPCFAKWWSECLEIKL